MGDYKAFVSLCLEHGIYAKKTIMEEVGVSEGDFVSITTSFGARGFTIERMGGMLSLKPRDEAYMLLSLFDILAMNHYYFLTEFGFTRQVSWIPKQYDYVIDVEPAFELLNSNSREHKAFKSLYSMVEDRFLDMAMLLRAEAGVDLYDILLAEDESLAELKSTVMEAVNSVADEVEAIFEEAFQGTDLVIGSGTFFSIMPLPLETAFSISGVDTRSSALPDCKREIAVNPFLLYWLLTKIFCSKGSELSPNYIPVKIEQVEGLKERESTVKMLKLRTYSPSKLYVETFYHSEDAAIQQVQEKLFNIFSIKPYIIPGDFLAPFTSPSIVRELELVGYEGEGPYRGPFVDATPYGLVLYKGTMIPKITHGTQVRVEFFTNPLYDKTRPLILDTNVISMTAFPYKTESPFFEAFMKGREVVIPAIVVYELKRKLGIKKERRNVTYALSRLREMHAMGLLNLKIAGELPPEIIVPEVLPQPTDKGVAKDVKYAKSDVRDVLIVLEANRQGGILFTNDANLRKLALMLGIPSISYNSLLDDAREVVREICKAEKAHKSRVIKAIRAFGLEVRGEEYSEEEVEMALSYLSILKEVKFEGEYITYTRR